MRLEFLIKEIMVCDGTGSKPFRASIGIYSDRIIINPETDSAETIIDGDGFILSPGFVDTHGHSEFTVLADPLMEGKLFQGITTEINGNCGLSGAPLYGEYLEHRLDDLREYDIRLRWNTLREYLKIIEDLRPSINFATLAGHGNIRGSVMGFGDRYPEESDMNKMKSLLTDAINDGAMGISTGLIYPPGIYSDTDELTELTRHGYRYSIEKKFPFIYASHMRSEGERLIESIEEVLSIAKNSGSPVHISHLKTAGKKNWHRINDAISLINNAINDSIKITSDRYPYTASSTDLDSILPSWLFEGGKEKELERLRNEDIRKRVRHEILCDVDEGYFDRIIISSVEKPTNRWMEGKSVSEISNIINMDRIDFIFHILIDERLRVGAIFHSMSEENLERFLAQPFMMIGSDSSSRSFNGVTKKGRPHPRGFGSFPRFLRRYVIEKQIITLEEAIHRITYLPCKTFGIKDRGVIRDNAFADIVIFDPQRIMDNADYNNPFVKPDGIIHVFVNGKPAILYGETTGIRNGRVLRNGR